MKLTMVLIFLAITNLMASEAYSQTAKMTLQLKDATVREVLNKIEENSEFFFLYNGKLVDVDRIVSMDVNDEKINDILGDLFRETDVVYAVVDRQIVLTNRANQNGFMQTENQQLRITGIVSGKDGSPLPGVNVVVTGITQGTITDVAGKYSIDVPAGTKSLTFSFIGMESREIIIGTLSQINVTMTETAFGLEEVVVIGYGVQKKVDLTGAISTVKGENLLKASVPNLSSALSGKITGVTSIQTSGQPGFDDATFRIRGVSTTGDNSPLIIVDGVERSFSRIDPNEIESVTVLKDAASTAVYGARAANGVLLITTKRGVLGKPVFSYAGTWGIQSQTRKIDLMNAAEYSKYINEAKANYDEELLFTDQEVADYQSGKLKSYNWLPSIFSNTAPQQKHNLSVVGGSENTNYFISFGYLDQSGFYSTSNYKQYSLRSNIDVKLTDRLKLSVNLAGRLEDRTRSSAGDESIYQGSLFARPIYDPLPVVDGVQVLGSNGVSGSPKGNAENSGTDARKSNIFQSNINLEYKVPGVEGLLARAMYSYDFQFDTQKVFKFPYTYFQLNESTGEYVALSGGASTINLNERRTYSPQSTLQLSLNYSKKIGHHTISALGLFEQSETYEDFISAFRDNYISTILPIISAGGTDLLNNDGSPSETARRGYVGRIDYDYKGKYLFQSNMRLDQSFNFPKNGRNGFFPAFSAGWRISEENFMKGFDALSNLKIRASWGKVGNDRIPAFQYLSNFILQGGTVIGNKYNLGIVEAGIANPLITWEKATTTDIGVDLGLWNNKLSFEFDYFSKRTEDILQPNTGVVPYTFGAELPDANIGIIDSWGTEGRIIYSNTFGELHFMADANYTWSDNKAIFVSEPIDILPSIAQTGRALGLRYGYLSDGLFQTEQEILAAPLQFSEDNSELKPGDIRYKDINGRDDDGKLTGKPDGIINDDDRAVISTSEIPKWIFGFNLNMEYKGFDVLANFQGATGFSRYIQPIAFERDGNTYRELIDSWRPGNENARYPRLKSSDLSVNNGVESDFWVTDVSYMRLRNLEIGYTLTSQKLFLKKIGIENLRIFVSGTNLLTISNLDWRDPEGASGRNPFYPQVMTTSFGVNVKF
jgi:TonB-linked SusC/RagA family outer membrane protein